jgi:hypothetical protein
MREATGPNGAPDRPKPDRPSEEPPEEAASLPVSTSARQPGLRRTGDTHAPKFPQPSPVKKAFKIAGALAVVVAWILGGSYYSEAPKYRFEHVAKSEAAAVPGARQLNAIKIVDIASPVSWFWPPATILNLQFPTR